VATARRACTDLARGLSGRAVTAGTVERIEGLLGWREITVSDRSEATQVVLIDPELTLTVSCGS